VTKFCRFFYRDTNRDERRSFIVAGTGRSGTTWLAEIIRSQIPCRLMFEPFNPRKVSAYRRFNYFQYMRPEERNAELREYCQTVVTGNIRNAWIDRGVSILRPQFRLIKDIRANLMLRWLCREFPSLPVVFLVRHPCAVVSSRMKLGWATDSDIAPLLEQPRLVEDHLADKMRVFERAKTPEEKHALVWCVSNLVPLRQFGEGELTTVFYENLCANPAAEIERVFRRLGHPYHASVFGRLHQPSMMSAQGSAVVTGDDRIAGWQKELSPRQIQAVLAVVEAFGLAHLYGESAMPRRP
jgi:Sulfotransferase family